MESEKAVPEWVVRILMSKELQVPRDKIMLTANIREDFGLDDLDEVELIMRTEWEHDIEIEDDDVEDLETLQDLLDLVERLAEAKLARRNRRKVRPHLVSA